MPLISREYWPVVLCVYFALTNKWSIGKNNLLLTYIAIDSVYEISFRLPSWKDENNGNSKMIIINFIRPQSGGNQRYTLELLKFLEKQSFLKYKVLLGSCNLKYFDKKLCDDYLIRYTPRNLLFSMIFESFWLTVQKSKLNCILFSPNTLVPFFLGRFKKNIVTVLYLLEKIRIT